MRIHINHTTRYSYNESVKHSIQCLRLTPQTLAHQRVLSWRMTLPRLSSEVYDGFGNYCTILNLAGPLQSLEIQAQGTVEIGGSAEHILDKRIHPLVFLNSTALTGCNEAMRDFAEIQTGGTPDRQGLMRLSRAVLDHMTYIPGTTHVATAAAEAFALGSGVCQDHTHVFLACARALDVPARYVSGYLLSDDDAHLASHAWAEACLDGKWYVFDTTNQLFQPSHHVQLAVGLDYNDAAPVRGMRQGGGTEKMSFSVQVQQAQ